MSATIPMLPKSVAELGPVCAKEHPRFEALKGIRLRVDRHDHAFALATDGMIAVEVKLGKADDCGGEIAIAVDPKLLKAALKACHARGKHPVGRITEDGVKITGNGAEVFVPNIPGEFPDSIDEVFPSDTSTVIGNHSINLAADLLARVSLALFKACGMGEPKLTFAFHGPKKPVRIDYVDGEFFEGRAVIMPIAPDRKRN